MQKRIVDKENEHVYVLKHVSIKYKYSSSIIFCSTCYNTEFCGAVIIIKHKKKHMYAN